jgi:hypothetical protein
MPFRGARRLRHGRHHAFPSSESRLAIADRDRRCPGPAGRHGSNALTSGSPGCHGFHTGPAAPGAATRSGGAVGGREGTSVSPPHCGAPNLLETKAKRA